MKKIYYRGKPYDYVVAQNYGNKQYTLIENGIVKYVVAENELDMKTTVSNILESYYQELMETSRQVLTTKSPT